MSAGIVSGRGLPHAVTVDQIFTADADGVVRWDLRFKSSSPVPFGSASLGLTLGAARPHLRHCPKRRRCGLRTGPKQHFHQRYLEPSPMRNFCGHMACVVGPTPLGSPCDAFGRNDCSLALSAQTVVDLTSPRCKVPRPADYRLYVCGTGSVVGNRVVHSSIRRHKGER